MVKSWSHYLNHAAVVDGNYDCARCGLAFELWDALPLCAEPEQQSAIEREENK